MANMPSIVSGARVGTGPDTTAVAPSFLTSRRAPALWAALGAVIAAFLPRWMLDVSWIPERGEWRHLSSDTAWFAHVWEFVWRGDLHSYLSAREFAVGPLQAFADWVIVTVLRSEQWYLPTDLLICFAVLATVAYLTQWVARSMGEVYPPARSLLAWAVPGAVGYAVFLSLPMTVSDWGHWWQIPVVLCWMGAALALGADDGDGYPARSWPDLRPGLVAGGLFAVAALLEPWAVLALPILLLARRWRTFLLAAGLACSVAVVAWTPMFLGEMGQVRWNIMAGSVWSFTGMEHLTWQMRAIQAGAVVAAAAAGALWCRRRAVPGPLAAMWLVVLVFAVRIAAEAFWFPYYLSAVEVIVLGWGAGMLALRRWWPAGISVATLTITHTQSAWYPVFYNGLLLAAASVALLVTSMPAAARDTTPTPMEPS